MGNEATESGNKSAENHFHKELREEGNIGEFKKTTPCEYCDASSESSQTRLAEAVTTEIGNETFSTNSEESVSRNGANRSVLPNSSVPPEQEEESAAVDHTKKTVPEGLTSESNEVTDKQLKMKETEEIEKSHTSTNIPHSSEKEIISSEGSDLRGLSKDIHLLESSPSGELNENTESSVAKNDHVTEGQSPESEVTRESSSWEDRDISSLSYQSSSATKLNLNTSPTSLMSHVSQENSTIAETDKIYTPPSESSETEKSSITEINALVSSSKSSESEKAHVAEVSTLVLETEISENEGNKTSKSVSSLSASVVGESDISSTSEKTSLTEKLDKGIESVKTSSPEYSNETSQSSKPFTSSSIRETENIIESLSSTNEINISHEGPERTRNHNIEISDITSEVTSVSVTEEASKKISDENNRPDTIAETLETTILGSKEVSKTDSDILHEKTDATVEHIDEESIGSREEVTLSSPAVAENGTIYTQVSIGQSELYENVSPETTFASNKETSPEYTPSNIKATTEHESESPNQKSDEHFTEGKTMHEISLLSSLTNSHEGPSTFISMTENSEMDTSSGSSYVSNEQISIEYGSTRMHEKEVSSNVSLADEITYTQHEYEESMWDQKTGTAANVIEAQQHTYKLSTLSINHMELTSNMKNESTVVTIEIDQRPVGFETTVCEFCNSSYITTSIAAGNTQSNTRSQILKQNTNNTSTTEVEKSFIGFGTTCEFCHVEKTENGITSTTTEKKMHRSSFFSENTEVSMTEENTKGKIIEGSRAGEATSSEGKAGSDITTTEASEETTSEAETEEKIEIDEVSRRESEKQTEEGHETEEVTETEIGGLGQSTEIENTENYTETEEYSTGILLNKTERSTEEYGTDKVTQSEEKTQHVEDRQTTSETETEEKTETVEVSRRESEKQTEEGHETEKVTETEIGGLDQSTEIENTENYTEIIEYSSEILVNKTDMQELSTEEYGIDKETQSEEKTQRVEDRETTSETEAEEKTEMDEVSRRESEKQTEEGYETEKVTEAEIGGLGQSTEIENTENYTETEEYSTGIVLNKTERSTEEYGTDKETQSEEKTQRVEDRETTSETEAEEKTEMDEVSRRESEKQTEEGHETEKVTEAEIGGLGQSTEIENTENYTETEKYSTGIVLNKTERSTEEYETDKVAHGEEKTQHVEDRQTTSETETEGKAETVGVSQKENEKQTEEGPETEEEAEAVVGTISHPKEVENTENYTELKIYSSDKSHRFHYTHGHDVSLSTEENIRPHEEQGKPVIIIVNNSKGKYQKLNKSFLEHIISTLVPHEELQYVDINFDNGEKLKPLGQNETAELNKTYSTCNKTDFESGKNCFCYIQGYLDTLTNRITNAKSIDSTENYCVSYIKPENGLQIQKSIKPAKRERRGLIYMGDIKQKGDRVQYDNNDIFAGDFQLTLTDKSLFHLPSENVGIPCSSHPENLTHQGEEMVWMFYPLSSTKGELLPEKGQELFLHEISVKNAGNYTCSPENLKDAPEKQNWHELELITFPIYHIVMNIYYQVNDSCNLQFGDILHAYLPKIASPILCTDSNDLCSIEIERPRCLTREDNNYFNVTMSAKMNPKFVLRFHDRCDTNCKLKAYENMVNIIYKNSEIFEHIPVHSHLEETHDIDFAPHLEGKEGSPVSLKPPKIIVSCPDGFGLESRKQRVCVLCPAQTFSNEDGAFCRKCPGGQYQPNPGSKSCLQCNSPVEDKMCLRMLYSDTKLFKIYVGVAFGFIVLMVIIIVIWTSGVNDSKIAGDRYYEGSLRHRAAITRKDVDLEIGANEPLLQKSPKRIPPQLPPVDF